MFWDTHMHTHFSTDSEALPEDMIKASIARHLDGICFTDHMDIDYPEPDSFVFDADKYFSEMLSLSHSYSDKIQVKIGIELGLQPHLATTHRALIKSHPYDFVIASSHLVDGMDPYYPEFFQKMGKKEGIIRYFQSILDNIDAYDDFDVYGHLDYIVRYAPDQAKDYSYREYADIIDSILSKLISMGKGIEVNMAGFKYGLGFPNPHTDILKRYRSLGGEILTLGADAHKPEHIAYDYHRLPSLLKECGFDYYTVFKNRQPEFIKI